MTTSDAIQVSKSQEDAQVAFIQNVVAFLTDATNLPQLRREVERLRAEAESLNRQIVDLKAEVELEREAKDTARRIQNERGAELVILQNKLSSLQHKFDTIHGVVIAAMAEIRPEAPKEEPKPSNAGPTYWPRQEHTG